MLRRFAKLNRGHDITTRLKRCDVISHHRNAGRGAGNGVPVYASIDNDTAESKLLAATVLGKHTLSTARTPSRIFVWPKCDRAKSGDYLDNPGFLSRLLSFKDAFSFGKLKNNRFLYLNTSSVASANTQLDQSLRSIVKSTRHGNEPEHSQSQPHYNFDYDTDGCVNYDVNKPIVKPQVFTQTLDLQNAYIGQVFEAPYEVTLTEGHRALHLSTFFDYDRISSSRSFAMRCGFPDAPLPFSLVLAHCHTLNHVDSTRDVLDLGFQNACYVQPVFPGDTVKKTTTIRGIRSTKNQQSTIVTLRNELYNQAKQLVMQVDKTMLYVGSSHKTGEGKGDLLSRPLTYSCHPEPSVTQSAFLKTIAEHAASIKFAHTRPLFEGQCIAHHMVAPLGLSRHLALLASVRQAHPILVNFARYSPEEIVVPGVIVANMAHAVASRSLFETLFERVDNCVFVNRVSPLDAIGAISYITGSCDLARSKLVCAKGAAASGLCEISVVTIGIKNLDIVRTLAGKELPKELFNAELKPSRIEELVTEKIPILSGRIAVISSRRLVRQSHYSRAEQMPLL